MTPHDESQQTRVFGIVDSTLRVIEMCRRR